MARVPAPPSSRRPAYTFTAEVWEHDGPAAWYFVSLPEDLSDEIDERHGHEAAGFGSLRVDVRIGGTDWSTSVFPDTKRGTFLLPIKKPVRRAEDLDDGTPVIVELRVVDPDVSSSARDDRP